MSKCVTQGDETVDLREINVKDIVGFVLEEAVFAALLNSEKGCGQIGDFNVTEDFCQQFDQFPAYSKDFDATALSSGQNCSGATQERLLESGESVDRSVSLLTAKENIEFILQSLIAKKESVHKVKSLNECKIISQEVLANNELRIENGHIRLERAAVEDDQRLSLNAERLQYFDKKDVIKDEKIEIEYFNEGKLNKIYVPLTNYGVGETVSTDSESKDDSLGEGRCRLGTRNKGPENAEKTFDPCSAEELRQVCSQVVADPNRPRAYAFAEEDVKKMAREIEEINLKTISLQLVANDFDAGGHRFDGKGDAARDSSSLTLDNAFKMTEDNDVSNGPSAPASAATSGCDYSKENFSSQHDDNRNHQRNNEASSHKIVKNDRFHSSGSENDSRMEVESINVITDGRLKNFDSESLVSSENEGERSFSESTKEKVITREKANASSLRSDSSLRSSNNQSRNDRPSSEEFLNKKGVENLAEFDIESETDMGIEKKNEQPILRTAEINALTSQITDGKDAREMAAFAAAAAAAASVDEATHNVDDDGDDNKEIRPVVLPSDVKTRESVISLCQIVASSPEKRTGTMKKSLSGGGGGGGGGGVNSGVCGGNGSGRDMETALSDSKLVFGKGSHGLKPSPKAFKTAENSEAGQGTSRSARRSTENQTGGSLILETELETSSLQSVESTNSSLGNEETDVLQSRAALVLPQISLFSKKSHDETGEIENVNHINYELYKENQMIIAEGSSSNLGSRQSLEQEIRSSSFADEDDRTCQYGGNGGNDAEGCQSRMERTAEEKEATAKDQGSQGSLVRNEAGTNLVSPPQSGSDPKIKNHSETDSGTVGKIPSTAVPGPGSKQTFIMGSFQPNDPHKTDATLIYSEEEFDAVENVIQIINPSENGNDEDTVSFSLPYASNAEGGENESSTTKNTDNVHDSCSAPEHSSGKQIRSGMTTIGPMKNLDHDPKDLTSDVDYGKMTRISSSRKLNRESAFKSPSSSKYLKMADESDEETNTMTIEEETSDIGSFVNRDIASLTKVQKIREVMSYHPKPEDDFEDETNLNRPRLDLKDVESMTDERYKMADVSIPLLSFEVGDSSVEAEKNLVQSLNLVLSGNHFDEGGYYQSDDVEEKKSSGNEASGNAGAGADADAGTDDASTFVELARDGDISQRKHGTLGAVFRKASSKLLGKDGNTHLRNTKSLPRDAAKLMATESIKSMLDECHSSAANMMKKSRSLLKNTQSLFKTMSQSRFGSGQGSSVELDAQKSSPSESDVRKLEGKLSFLRTEDFVKATTMIKNKVGKTLKAVENSIKRDSDESLKRSGSNVTELDDEDGTSRTEIFGKLLQKSPLVYKSQFVRSQMSVQRDSPEEADTSAATSAPTADRQQVKSMTALAQVGKDLATNEIKLTKGAGGTNKGSPDAGSTDPEKAKSEEGSEIETQVADYIVMETVEGLTAVDLDASRYVVQVDDARLQRDAALLLNKSKVTLAAATDEGAIECDGIGADEVDFGCDVGRSETALKKSRRTSDRDDSRASEGALDGGLVSEKKTPNKSKKLSARLRSFWSSAFGKVKASPRKRENF